MASRAPNHDVKKRRYPDEEEELPRKLRATGGVGFHRLATSMATGCSDEEGEGEDDDKTEDASGGVAKGLVAIMRHSVRLDDVFGGVENIPEVCACLLDCLLDCCCETTTAQAAWHDKAVRPWDPPIVDWELPQRSAQLLQKFRFSVIVSSPFRRCLQTAGIVARVLKIGTVYVDNRLGEVRRTTMSSNHLCATTRV